MKREKTATVLSRNVAMLANRAGLDLQDVAIKAQIGIRTLHHVMAGRNTTVDTAEAIARVFGLTCWHLLNPNLESDINNQAWLDRVSKIFGTQATDGIDLLKRAVDAAETMAAVQKAKNK